MLDVIAPILVIILTVLKLHHFEQKNELLVGHTRHNVTKIQRLRVSVEVLENIFHNFKMQIEFSHRLF